MSNATIPTVDQLDPSWFTAVLRAGGHLTSDCRVTGAALTEIGAGSGMMSRVWRVALTYDETTTAPSSVIVKLATDDPHRLFIAQTAKFYAREIRFYNELAPTAPVRVARSFHAAIDPDTSNFVLVLDDLGELRSVDQLTACGFDDAVEALRTIARFHARWWGVDHSQLTSTFMAMNDGFNQFVVPTLHQQSWPAARHACPELWPDDVAGFLDGFTERVPQILDGIMGPNTLIHNDYRVDNLLWDGHEVVVLDFQLSAVASGMLDVTFFLAQSITRELRQARFDELIDAYLDELAANGVVLTREAALDKYRRSLVFGFLWPLGLMGGYETLDQRGKELAQVMLDRHLSAVRDADALAVYA